MGGDALSLDAAAALVASLGSRELPERLWDVLSARLPLCHLSAARFNQPHPEAVIASVDWLFARNINPAHDTGEVAQRYVERYWREDPLLSHIKPLQDPQLVLIRHNDIPAEDYAQDVFRNELVTEECNLLVRGEGGVYVLAVYRMAGQPSFSLEELSLLRRWVPLLLALLMQHARLTVSTRRSELPSLPRLFDKRVATDGVKLSPRERAICHYLLQGWSAPKAAHAMGVRESSSKTYVDRAFVKLGVRSKAELFDWCLRCA